MSQEDSVLDKIVELQGDCLDAKLCRACPFASTCLPDFIRDVSSRPSKEQRLQMALDLITRKVLFDDDDVLARET